MAASPSILSALIQARMASNFEAVLDYNPLNGHDTSYFQEFCTAFGSGIATGTITVPFVTADTGLKGIPFVAGVGTGIGIIVDEAFFKETIYTNVRNAILAQFGRTNNIPFPPTTKFNGLVLQAMAEAISHSVKTHFATVWTLTSTHPMIYSGTGLIENGDYSGISSSLVNSQIQVFGPRLSIPGSVFPNMSLAVAQAYKTTIETMSTGTVTITGTCSPSVSQVCAVPSTGTGSGVAT